MRSSGVPVDTGIRADIRVIQLRLWNGNVQIGAVVPALVPGTNRKDRVRWAVILPNETPQVAESVSGGEQPERAFAENLVDARWIISGISERRETRHRGASRVQRGDCAGRIGRLLGFGLDHPRLDSADDRDWAGGRRPGELHGEWLAQIVATRLSDAVSLADCVSTLAHWQSRIVRRAEIQAVRAFARADAVTPIVVVQRPDGVAVRGERMQLPVDEARGHTADRGRGL